MMVQTIGTNNTNDIFLDSHGNLSVMTGENAVMVACRNASLMQKGEAVLQSELGIPSFTTIWGGVPNVAAYENSVRSALLSVSGVISVDAISARVSDNILSYNAVITSEYGRVALNV